MRSTALVLGLTLAACSGAGSAEVTGSFGSFTLELNTVYGWIDATESKMDGGKLVFAPRDKPRLHVVMSGAVFDPDQDLRFVSASELVDLARESQRLGSASLVVRNYHVFTVGGQLAIPNTGEGDAPRLEMSLALGLNELESDATYPAAAPEFGDELTATLTLTEAGRAAGESVVGTVVVKLAPDEDDPADALGGEITIELDAPLISEWVAECNGSGQLADSECEPGLPRVSGG